MIIFLGKNLCFKLCLFCALIGQQSLAQLFPCPRFFYFIGGRTGISNTISTQNLWNLFENRPFFDKTKTLSTALLSNNFAGTYLEETLLLVAKIGKLLISFGQKVQKFDI